MAILTDAEVQDLWATWADGLTETCQILPLGETTDPDQGKVRDWSGAPVSVPCALISGAQAIQAGVYPDETTGAPQIGIAFARDITINAGDRVAVNGVTWSVTGDPTIPGTYDPGVIVGAVKASLAKPVTP